MTSKQEAKLNMFRATQKHCADNATIVATIPAFQAGVTSLNTLISSIIATAQQEDLVTKGITVDKAEAKKTLCQLAADVAAPIIAFAAANNNNQLLQEVNFSYTELFRSKDDQLAPRCQNIHKAANTNIAALGAYGINAATVATLQTTINNYQAAVPNPRNAAAQKVTIRANLKSLIKQADTVLKLQLDKTIVGLKATKPDFVATYKTNRIILDPSKTTTTLKGTVTNSVDITFIAGAKIVLDPLGLTATTNNLGEYEIKPISADTYSVIVTATKYQSLKVSDIVIKQGQINKQDFTLTLE
jgi:hypothetical protein